MFNISYSSSGPGMDGIMRGIDALNGADALVGIPEGDNRAAGLIQMAGELKATKKGKGSKRAIALVEEALSTEISNAELLFIFSNGSPLRGQPARQVIEPAIEEPATSKRIARALAKASTAALDGNEAGMLDALDRAGQIGESASKRWFTDPRNGWEPNAPSTIRSKGSETPGIDTGQMRRAITHVTESGSGVHEGNATDYAPDRELAFGPEAEGAGELAEVAEVAAL